MRPEMPFDEALPQHLPLPLAQLYRRAHNAKTPLDRHLTAFYLWEASLKLLGCAAVVAYAGRPEHDPHVAEKLQNLARPSPGHWWDFVRTLLPLLADGGEPGFAPLRELLLGRTRDDFPRAAGLDAALREALEGKATARATVRFTELFDRVVRYRNREIGHGAAGQRPADWYERMGAALLAAAAEVLGRTDLLAGRRLLYLGPVSQQGGAWHVPRYELTGEAARRLAALVLPREAAPRLPDGERVYLGDPAGGAETLTALHPLLLFDAEAGEVLFLNARRGRQRTEYLGYSSGRSAERADLGGEQRALLARVLGLPVAEEQVAGWEARSRAEEPPDEAPAAPARRTLGEFELLSELGQGGMGVVYRAWQPSLGRQVALKKLLHGGARTEARFRREVRALGKVEHTHLVRIFTSGSDGDQWFYAMELVEGAPLSAVCDRLRSGGTDVDLTAWRAAVSTVCEEVRRQEKPLGDRPTAWPSRPAAEAPAGPALAPGAGGDYVRQVVELVRQAAAATHALHEAGVVHRDIKPGNVLVSADGRQATLVDLGLAHLADDEGRLTQTRQFVGTLRYASPEQVLAAGPVDRRTDVYSLGATLWELLTLRPLFGATEQTPTPDLMLMIQSAEPESPRRHNPHVPRDLEAIVLKCLEKDRGRRYATAAELVEDLGRWLRGEPVLAHRQTVVYRLGKRVRRHRRKVVAAAVVALLLPVVWLALADGGTSVPGSQGAQHWLDRHEASLFRRAPSEAELRAAATRQRRALRDYLLDMVTRNDGWAMKDAARDADCWTQMQTAAAFFSAPEDDGGYPPVCVKVITCPFEPHAVGGEFTPGLGWPHWGDHEPSAEAVAWANFAIPRALARPGAVSADDRRRLLGHLEDVQAALETYLSRDEKTDRPNGGWNLFPVQKDPGEANLYSGLMAAQALLELRRTDLPWRGSRERRDALLAQSLDWLLRQYREPGWSTPGTVRESFNDGLTLQIFTVLLQAEAAGAIELPPAVLEQVPHELAVCGAQPLDHRSPAAVFVMQIYDPTHGDRPGAREPLWSQRLCRSLWYAWAIHCAACWVRRCERVGAPHDEVVRTRRVLGHLLLELGDPAVEEAKQGFTYVAAETMLCLASLEAP
jgi:serine/threonine protein kinase